MVKLNVEGDWSPRLREVEIIERVSSRWPPKKSDVLRAVLEFFDVKVRRNGAWIFRDLTRSLGGRGSRAPLVVLNVGSGPSAGGPGIMLGKGFSNAYWERIYRSGVLPSGELARLVRLPGRVVLCLGPGLGTRRMAEIFMKGGASAYIGLAGDVPVAPASSLLFSIGLLYEMGRNGATVREAWARAAAYGRDTRRFRLFIRGRGGRMTVPAIPPAPAPVPKIYGEAAGSMRGVRWKPPVLEVDALTMPLAPCVDPSLFRMVLEQWGFKVNLHPCEGPRDLRRCLSGKGMKAPLFLVLSHGTEDGKGGYGILYRRTKSGPRVMGADEIGRVIDLPGRVVVAEGCSLGDPVTARAFLKGRLRGYIAGAGGPWWTSLDEYPGSMFSWRFFYELGVSRLTVGEAWKRARAMNDETRRYILYPGGSRIGDMRLKEPRVVRAPALLEGFERNTDNDWERDWNGFNYTRGLGIAAPGGRSGLALRMNYAFRENQWPELMLYLSWAGHKWLNAGAVSFDVYVPHSVRLARPLTCIFMVIGEKHAYEMVDLVLRRGWNHIDLPFDSPLWRGKEGEKGSWRTEPFDIDRVQPVKRLWIALHGKGRREEGAVYFDNLRLEGKA